MSGGAISKGAAYPFRFSPRVGFVYAAGDVGPSLTSLCLAFYWLYFLVSVAGLHPMTAGAIHASGYVLSAVINLFAGHVLDRHVPAAHQRARLIAILGCAMALFFLFMWVVPGEGSLRIAWYLLVSWLFHFLFSFVYLSYLSFTALLGASEREHVDLNSYRFGATMALALAVLGLHTATKDMLPAARLAMLGGMVATLAAAGSLVCGLCLGRWFKGRPTASGGMMPWRALLRDRALWASVGANLAIWFMVQMTLVLTAFLCAAAAVGDGPVLLLLQFSMIAAAAATSLVARHLSASAILVVAFACWCLGACLWRLGPPPAAAAMLGLGLGAGTVLSWAGVARSVTLLSERSGQRSEARAYAGLTVLRDLISALVPLLAGSVLSGSTDLVATSTLLIASAIATGAALWLIGWWKAPGSA